MTKTIKDQVEVMSALLLTMEYEELYFIPNFNVRMATAKAKAITLIKNKCNCDQCNHAVNYINNLNFNEYD
jgi:hypothetical protein